MISVILPTYNERDSISELIERLAAVLPAPVEIIVVDDGSADGTVGVVEDLLPRVAGLRLVRRDNARGLAGAIQRGIDEAIGDVIVWMDADLSMPPESVPQLLTQVRDEGWDAAIGSRYIAGGSQPPAAGSSLLVAMQRSLTRGLNRFASCLAHAEFHDWTSGFIAVRATVIKPLRLQGAHGEYFIPLLAELSARDYSCIEVPYTFRPRSAGVSKTAGNAYTFFRHGLRYLVAVFAARRATRAQ